MELGRLILNPKTWIVGGVATGVFFLAQEMPFVGGDDAPDKDKARTNTSTINCALTSEKAFNVTEAPTELKAERGSGHAESLGYFAVKSEGSKVKIVHAWDPNVKLMGEMGAQQEIQAYNGQYKVKTHKAEVKVICPSDSHNN